MLSRSSRYLWASARGRANTTFGSYLSGFLLDDDGSIVKKMFTVQVSPLSGAAHSITPAPWGDEWLVMTDSVSGYVQMWRMKGGRDMGAGMEYSTVEPVARVDIFDGGCCGNAIWYN
jgi:carboxy-cis,cis-muconate cyclase